MEMTFTENSASLLISLCTFSKIKRFIKVTRGCGYYGSMVDRQSTEREDIGSKPGQTSTNTKGLNYRIYYLE